MNGVRARLSCVAGVAFLLALATTAAAQDRPDLIDFQVNYSDTTGFGSSNGMSGLVSKTAASGKGYDLAYGAFYTIRAATVHGRAFWGIFEPDQTKRKLSATKRSVAVLKQSHYVLVDLDATTSATSFTASGIVEGCHAVARFKDKDGNGTMEEGKWRLGCRASSLATDLALTPQQAKAVEKALRNLSIKGKGIIP